MVLGHFVIVGNAVTISILIGSQSGLVTLLDVVRFTGLSAVLSFLQVAQTVTISIGDVFVSVEDVHFVKVRNTILVRISRDIIRAACVQWVRIVVFSCTQILQGQTCSHTSITQFLIGRKTLVLFVQMVLVSPLVNQ